jgi:DNA-binding MarR family transcriptional regulator
LSYSTFADPTVVIPGSASGDTEAQVTAGDSGADQVDGEILECLGQLIASLIGRADEIAQRLGVPAFFLKALQRMDCPMAMKDLGQRMHCDPSFVTGIADMLEQRGLATRESDPADRRVRRIALTPAGLELKQQVDNEILASLPWRGVLDTGERAHLLSLVRKIVPGGKEVSEVLAGAPGSSAHG